MGFVSELEEAAAFSCILLTIFWLVVGFHTVGRLDFRKVLFQKGMGLCVGGWIDVFLGGFGGLVYCVWFDFRFVGVQKLDVDRHTLCQVSLCTWKL